jgi:outer membrane protein assembly factor BamB
VAVNACASVQRLAPATQDRAWRTYLGSDFRAPATRDSLNADPQPVWRSNVARGIIGAPALTEDLVVVSQVDRQVAVLDRATGDVVWRHRVANVLGSGPLVDGDRVLVATQEERGEVRVLQLATGTSLWSARVGDIAAPLALDDSTVYAASTEGTVVAFRLATGARLWRARLTGAVRAAPVPSPAGLVVATTSDSVFLLDRGTGAVRARRGVPGSIVAAPASLDTLLVAGTAGGELLALRPEGLALRWRVALGAGAVGSVAVQNGVAWALDEHGTLWRVPLADPAASTNVPTRVVSRAGPTPTASGVLLSGADGALVLVDPDTRIHRR